MSGRDFVSPPDDKLFKELFINEKNDFVITRFLSDYLNIPYEDIKGKVRILNSILFSSYDETKGKEVDVLVEQENNIINIEMNLHYNDSTIMRNYQYLMNLLIGDIKVGEEYNKESTFLQINFNDFDINNSGRLKESFYIQSDSNNKLIENIRIDHINMSKIKDSCYNESEEMISSGLSEKQYKSLVNWIKILTSKNSEELKESVSESNMSNEEKNKVVDICERFTKDSIERMFYDPLEEERKLYRSEIAIMKRKEQKKLEESKKLGIEQGIEQGSGETRKSIIKGMIEEGIDISLISKITGLSVEDINNMMKST